jgi:hypothetical protein
MLNGRNLTVKAGDLPRFDGVGTTGDKLVMPSGKDGVCAVGFVEATYATPVPACTTGTATGSRQ